MMVIYIWPLWWGLIWPQGCNLNNRVGPQDKGLQNEATYQVSKAWAFLLDEIFLPMSLWKISDSWENAPRL